MEILLRFDYVVTRNYRCTQAYGCKPFACVTTVT